MPLLTRIAHLPRAVPFLVILALTLIGGFAPFPAGVCLLLVAAILGWIGYLGWPRLTSAERLMRVAVIALVLAIAVIRLNPRS